MNNPVFVMTPEQIAAMGAWVEPGESMANVYVEYDLATGSVHVTQGDSSVEIEDDGTAYDR